MAGNEWINGYLEAILDAGSTTKKKPVLPLDGRNKLKNIGRLQVDENNNIDKDKDNKKGEKLFSPTKYFVEEVVNSFDESDLHRTWVKVGYRFLICNSHFCLSIFSWV